MKNAAVEHANEVIRAYQDLDAARERLSAEVQAIEECNEPRIRALLHGPVSELSIGEGKGTLDELRALLHESVTAQTQLKDLSKKTREARSAAYGARNKAIQALVAEGGLLDIDRPEKVARMIGQRSDGDGPREEAKNLSDEIEHKAPDAYVKLASSEIDKHTKFRT